MATRSSWLRPPIPRRLPAIRNALVDQLRRTAEEAQRWVTEFGDHQAEWRQAIDGLAKATLYSVPEDATARIANTGVILLDDPIYPNDIPSRYGFVVFDKPLFTRRWLVDSSDEKYPSAQQDYVAVRWAPSYDGHDIAVTAGVVDDDKFGWDITYDWRFGEPFPCLPVDCDYEIPVFRTLKAFWLLVTEPYITKIEAQPASKTDKRRAMRNGCAWAPVHVVRMRASLGPAPGDHRD